MNRSLLGALGAAALAVLFSAGAGTSQSLADFDYENLTFRGFSLEGGYLSATRVDPAYSIGTRIDLGYLGPGLRIVPGVSYWSSTMKSSEVRELEDKVESLIDAELPPGASTPQVNLGTIDWSDIALTLDGHFVWSVPYDLLTFAGAGVSAHILNGDGDAIAGTFVEDLLDSVAAGLNLHAGLEYPLHDRFRLYGVGRYEVLEDLRYLEFRLGGQITFAPPAPGEERSR
jgi:hypothetical protein